MLCTLFTTYLENKPMRLHDLTRAARRARKRYALAVTHYAEAETAAARKRAERRTKAARRAARAFEIGATQSGSCDTKVATQSV